MKKPIISLAAFSKAIFTLAMIASLSGMTAGTARADDWRDHEREAHEWHRHHVRHERPIIVEEPNVVYAPPVIVEPPALPSGLNLILPINIR